MPARAISDAIDEILGRPYQLFGRGPAAFDCMGVVLYVLRSLGEDVPDPAAEAIRAGALDRFRACFIELPCLGVCEAGDVVHTSGGNLSEQGLAVVESKIRLATAQREVGVTRLRWSDIGESVAKAYRLKSRC